MNSPLGVLYNRSRYILSHGGFWSFFKEGIFYFKDFFFQNSIYLFYEIDLASSHLPEEPKYKTDFTLKVISNLMEYNQLVIEGYDFKSHDFQPLLAKGATAYCLFAKKDLIYQGWVILTEKAKQEIDPVPYKIDFDRGEVGIGGYFCDPEYRGKGFHNYVLAICFRHLSQNGIKKIMYSIKKGNVASRKAGEKYNHKVLGQKHYLRILWWKSWKEIPPKKEKQ